MNRDEPIIALAKEIVAKTRASGLGSDDYQAAFRVASELMHAQWSAEWKANSERVLGEMKIPE